MNEARARMDKVVDVLLHDSPALVPDDDLRWFAMEAREKAGFIGQANGLAWREVARRGWWYSGRNGAWIRIVDMPDNHLLATGGFIVKQLRTKWIEWYNQYECDQRIGFALPRTELGWDTVDFDDYRDTSIPEPPPFGQYVSEHRNLKNVVAEATRRGIEGQWWPQTRDVLREAGLL